ncbi:hypothetical protein ACWDZ8_41375 [Streptomyces sp. NPDC003233]
MPVAAGASSAATISGGGSMAALLRLLDHGRGIPLLPRTLLGLAHRADPLPELTEAQRAS